MIKVLGFNHLNLRDIISINPADTKNGKDLFLGFRKFLQNHSKRQHNIYCLFYIYAT